MSYFSPFVDQSSPYLLAIYGSDHSLQRRFPIHDILFQCGDIHDHVANRIVENEVFRLQNFRRRTPEIRYRSLYAPMGTHQVGKLGAIPPTDPDDISQSTPNFC